ncbi:transcriptional regulator domain protein [Acinetobacter baumannii 25691_7]|nr:transcriptional regulator domain protein [Acinetobacter baumannii 23037]KCZ42702.1 transcriptional regulator domain protein [Acinetobacter baumannii 25691_7]
MTVNRRRPKHDPKESEREILNAAEKFLSERPNWILIKLF